MLVIRFLRKGKKNQPFFRIVVTDKKNPPRGGRFLEIVGFFNPLTKEKKINKERVKYWLSVGAKPSTSLHNLLIKEGIIKGKKIAPHPIEKAKEKPQKVNPPTNGREVKEEVKEVKGNLKQENPSGTVVDKTKENQS